MKQPTFDPYAVVPLEQRRATLARLRATCPVSHVAPGVVFVASREEARDALRDHGGFSSRGVYEIADDQPPLVTQLDPPEHAALRALLRDGFDRAAVVDAAPWVESVVSGLIDGFADTREADLVAGLSVPLTESVIARLCGIPEADSRTLAQWSLEITAMMPSPRFDTEQWFRIERYVAGRIDERRRSSDRPADMLTRLIEGRLDGRELTDREIAFHLWLLFIGGLETTAYTLAATIHELLVERQRWERLVADRSLLGSAVEEGLRHASALRFVMRKATGATEIAGCPVEPGQTVFVGVESANHDESTFAHPERFDLDRGNSGRHLSFGHGIHTCLGAALARTELSAALTALADRVPGLRLAPGYVYEEVPNPMFAGPTRLDVVW